MPSHALERARALISLSALFRNGLPTCAPQQGTPNCTPFPTGQLGLITLPLKPVETTLTCLLANVGEGLEEAWRWYVLKGADENPR